MEEQGVPAIAIVTTPFRNTGRAMAESWGKPGYPFLDIPHPIANLTEAQLDARCDRLAAQVAERLGVAANQPGPPPRRPTAPPPARPRSRRQPPPPPPPGPA